MQQFSDRPDVIGQFRLHRRSDPQLHVDTAEIVVREMQAVRRPQILPLLAEPVGQPRESTDFKDGGFVDQERKVTYTLKCKQAESLWKDCSFDRPAICGEYWLNRLFFDLTCAS